MKAGKATDLGDLTLKPGLDGRTMNDRIGHDLPDRENAVKKKATMEFGKHVSAWL
jgi:hypothetical protein